MSSDVYIVSGVPFMSDVSIVCVASAISFALVRCVWCHLKLVTRWCPLNLRCLLCLLCMMSSVSEVSDMSDVISI